MIEGTIFLNRRLMGVVICIIAVFLFCSVVFAKNADARDTTRRKEKYNVIFVVVDALRADHLGCYGYGRDTSPFIDSLAKEGVLFSRAFSTGSKTIISVPSLLSSLYPSAITSKKCPGLQDALFISLPEILEEHGYKTAAFVGPQLGLQSHLGDHFQAYEVISPFEKDGAEARISWNKISYWIVQGALDFLKDTKNNPFFLYIHFLDVHTPYTPAAPFDSLFWNKPISPELRHRLLMFRDSPGYDRVNAGVVTEKEFSDLLVSQYDGEIREIDYIIRELFEELDILGLSENTMIIFTSDHGEEFGEHGSYSHSGMLYDTLLRVPLIMRLPKVLPEGKVIEDQVSHVDLVPTVLELLGIRDRFSSVQGNSLLSLIRNKNSESFRKEVYSEYVSNSSKIGMRSVRTPEIKCIEHYNLYSGQPLRYEMYDLRSDPLETINVADSLPEKLGYFKNKLKAFYNSCLTLRHRLPERAGISRCEPEEELSQEEKQILKNLGYLE